MGVEMTGEAKERVERHLDEVEGVLRGRGRSREERRGVVDDLEAQILDMVAERGAGGLAEVEEVLRELDPPGEYGGEPRVGRRAGARGRKGRERRTWLPRGVAIAVIVCGLVLLLTPVVFDYAYMRAEAEMRRSPVGSSAYLFNPMDRDPMRIFLILLGLAGLGLGVGSELEASWRERKREGGRKMK